MLEVNKIPSLAISRTTLRNNITRPISKGSSYFFVTPDENTMYADINKFTLSTNKFNIFALRAAYHPNADYVFFNSANRLRLVNYRKTFMSNMQKNAKQLPILKTDVSQMNGLNFVYCVPYIFETAKAFNRENKPAMLWSMVLEKYRREVGIPTVFDKNLKKVDIVAPVENPYTENYMIFNLDHFDLPNVSDLNIAKSAKHPDALRNFLYFLQYESKTYNNLLTNINFLFISEKGVIKIKFDESFNLIEEYDIPYNQYVKMMNIEENYMFIEERAKNVVGLENINDTVRTLTIMLQKIKPGVKEEISPEDEKVLRDKNVPVIVSTPEADAVDNLAVEKLRELEPALETLTPEHEEDLSNELLQIDKDKNSTDASKEQVDAIINKVNDARQEKVRVMSVKERGALNKMQNLKVASTNKTVSEILSEEMKPIPKTTLPIESHQGYDENSFHEFTNAYNDSLRHKHIVQAAAHFQDAEIPLYVDKIDIVDNSDKFNEIDTVSTRFRDEDGNTFTVTVDLPKMYKGNRIKINSSEKVLIGQLTYLPILKIDDSVIITTNYNKIFMEKKYGNGLTPQANKLIRAIKKMEENNNADFITFGDYSNANLSSKILSEEMKELSSVMSSIGNVNSEYIRKSDAKDKILAEDSTGMFFLSFNDVDVQILHNMLAPEDIGDHTIIGFADGGKNPIFLDNDSSRVSIPSLDVHEETIYSAILKLSDKYNVGIRPYYDDIKTVNKLTSTYIKIMNNWIPLIYILIYTDGLYSILERLGINYEIIPIDEKKRRADKEKEIKVELKDCVLYINIEDIASSILFYPLQSADLSMYELADLEKPQHTADVLITNTNGDINFPLYINTFRSCLIDPYTKSVLEYLDQPTEFVGVFLYANNLLASPVNMDELSLNSCRIRYAEVIQAVYYKELANAYAEYSAKKKRGSKSAKMSIPRDKVCTSVMALPNVEEYSRINPYQESVKRYSCNYKGHLGKNVSRAYTWKARSYHPTYMGSIGLPTAFSANIGINKQLTVDPKVTNLMGMFDVTDDPNTLKSKQIITSTEAITVGSATHSDAPRNAMNQAQKSHIIPVEHMSTGYVTNSYDRMMAYTSDDFVDRAVDDGVVESVTDNYIVVKYNNGTTSSIKLVRTNKNSAKGKFVISYMKPTVKAGQKIKKNDIIARDKDFFKQNDLEGLVATMGSMLNIIWKAESCVYEDSVVISETASKLLMNRAIKRVAARFHKSSKVLEYKKIGEFVNADTVLISYVPGTEDDLMNQFLDGAEMTELDKKERTAHKAGIIRNINITHSCDKSSMSSSVSRLYNDVSKQILEINEEKYLQKSNDEFAKREYTELPQEVKGEHKLNGEVIAKDEVLVEYFIEYPDFMGIGDKGSQFTALKGIVASVLPDDQMPIGVDSGRKVDLICSFYSPGARKTFDVNHVFVANCLMEKLTNDARELFLGKK